MSVIIDDLDTIYQSDIFDRMPPKKKTQFALLGLLMWSPMSGYDMKRLVDVGLSHFWSENYGQIYPTLEQFVRNGLATKKSERKSGNRQRFVYTITADGRDLFRQWISEPTDAPLVRNELQLKLFLCGKSPSQSLRLIEQYQTQQQAQLDEYRKSEELLRTAIRGKEVIDELDEILAISTRTIRQRERQLNSFLLTLRHGVRVVEARLAWCDEAIQNLSE